ncbi:MAG: class I SAM-dependent methyltransferase [Parcubacteria group bacterium]|nr:class I SAM-dependent methyltransferase [Parcubacteria group bacterium]
MNSINLIKKLLDEKNNIELTNYLSNIWNKVWSENGEYNYANLRLFKTADKIKNILDAGVNFNNKRVLDIGCGNGTTLMYLRKHFNIKGVGIDISKNVVKKLQENIKDANLSFYEGDFRNLQTIEHNQFDIILSFGVIEHFEEYGLALAEARRILKPNGQLILIQPHLFSFGFVQEQYLRLMNKWKFGKQKDFSCFYYRLLLQKLGFKDIKFFTKPPYHDMKFTRIFDTVIKKVIPFWGHYLYLIGKK